MATLDGNLWDYNLCRVLVVDVSTDYPHCRQPLPSEFYPILREIWLPRHNLQHRIMSKHLIDGFLYDWHEGAPVLDEPWYVGVVKEASIRP